MPPGSWPYVGHSFDKFGVWLLLVCASAPASPARMPTARRLCRDRVMMAEAYHKNRSELYDGSTMPMRTHPVAILDPVASPGDCDKSRRLWQAPGDCDKLPETVTSSRR